MKVSKGMHTEDTYPIVVVPSLPNETGGIRFLHRNSQLDVRTHSSLIWKILSQCNGFHSVNDIADITNVPLETVKAIIKDLISLEVVVDSRKQYLHFHKISNYPTGFNRNLTQSEIQAYTLSSRTSVKEGNIYHFNTKKSAYGELLELRRSCRSFSTKRLNLDLVGSICHYGYFISKHCTPSGGALYPLKIYVLVETEQDGLPIGYYEYDSEKDCLVQFKDTIDIEQLKHCFNSEELAFGSSVQVVIAADLNRQTYKYSNRGYRLTLLEAGHVAANINSFCTEQGLGTCELGGVLDEPFRKELDMRDEVFPLVAIAIGYIQPMSKPAFNEIAFIEDNLRNNTLYPLSCENLSYGATTYGDDCPFFGAFAKYGMNTSDMAGATSASYSHAVFKAVIEAYERKISSQVRIDYFGSADDLDKQGLSWLDPTAYVPLTKLQMEKCGVVPFSKTLSIQWTQGFSYIDKTKILVPSDIVYYGHNSDGIHIYNGNSSGIAAHTDKTNAKVHALAELIERDAIMKNWFSRQSPPILSEKIIPFHAMQRIKFWQKKSRQVFILEMPSLFAKVILAVIVSEQYPCFVCGASATLDHSEEAFVYTVNKALQEAEYCVYSYTKYPVYDRIEPHNVLTPTDHGRIYHTAEYIDSLKWLWSGEIIDNISDWKIRSFSEIVKELELIEIVLSPDNSPIHVVKMLSSKLVPISFGYYNAHYTHSALKGQFDKKSVILPHYFA